MLDEVRIDYEKLATDYLQGLTTVLRGFQAGSGYDFLATWVYDENEIRGVLGVIEAAQDAGVRHLVIHLGQATLRKLDLLALTEAVVGFAKVQVNQDKQGADLCLEFTSRNRATQDAFRQSRIDNHQSRGVRTSPQFQAIPSNEPVGGSLYEEGLRQAARSATHEGALVAEPGQILVEATCNEIVLHATVDPSRHTIMRAAYQGTKSETETGLLEALCRLMEGKPIVEVSDHGVICLELELRGQLRVRPVAGIVLPKNADPMFALPLRLVRTLLANYRAATGFEGVENFYSPSLSPSWKALNEEQRTRCLKDAITSHPLGSGIELVQLEMADRVVVKFLNGHETSAKQSQLIQLEARLKKMFDPNLQIYIQPKTDENKMRRIKERIL